MKQAVGRIGPNAITRYAEVLGLHVGEAALRAVFARAELQPYLAHPPQSMVDEREAARLQGALREVLGLAQARAMSRAAGASTAAYLLAHRIPGAVQALLKCLPALLAARLLLRAVARHAWTFAGSGRFGYVVGRPTVLSLRDNPMCRGAHLSAPTCAFYGAVFECLFRALVHREAHVEETECEACGGRECRFVVRW